MIEEGTRLDDGEGAFDLLAGLTARLASTARLEQIVDTVLEEIVALGFGAVWMAVLDEPSGHLLTVKEVIDGVDTTHEMPKIFMLDMRQPIGHGFRERRMINVVDPDALHIIEQPDDPVPPGALALPRVIYEHLRGHPFACGPLLGSRGQPVGALGLSSYRGQQPIPDAVLGKGLLRAFMDHLGIAMERALHIARLERMNADLVKAQEAIARDARLKAVGELAAAVAHDLNNLSGIALMAVSVGARSPEAASEALQPIERATRAIGDLVARLQRVARAGATDAAAAEQATASPGLIVEDILLMMAPVLREHSIAVELDAPTVPRVRADPALLHQVVLNLVLNARDALQEVPPERRALRIRLRDDDGLVRILVADSGPGIAPHAMAQLFHPFVTTKGTDHLGLGLAAAHASLEHLGGSLVGRNSPSGGAVFEVTLEMAPAEARPERPPQEIRETPAREASPAVQPGQPIEHAGRATDPADILVVDDDHDVVHIVSVLLEPLGHRVTTATTADQALDLAASRTFDLVLCDVGMPRRSGLDICQTLRKGGFGGKIILMTGWDGDKIQADQRAAASDRLLRKPFLGADLLHVIESMLADERESRAKEK
jgi:signal transduction histidine kinase/ActR/RegA family two-component response regulator